MLHRARAALADRKGPTPPLSRNDDRVKATLAQYVDAWESADIPGLVGLLKDDAILAMPPSPTWVRGRDEVGLFLESYVFDGDARGRWLTSPTSANGQPAFGPIPAQPRNRLTRNGRTQGLDSEPDRDRRTGLRHYLLHRSAARLPIRPARDARALEPPRASRCSSRRNPTRPTR